MLINHDKQLVTAFLSIELNGTMPEFLRFLGAYGMLVKLSRFRKISMDSHKDFR
jgi:hypothetical protein